MVDFSGIGGLGNFEDLLGGLQNKTPKTTHDWDFSPNPPKCRNKGCFETWPAGASQSQVEKFLYAQACPSNPLESLFGG